MISLNILTDMCHWWPLWWLLPFLLGILLGWAIWAKWAKRCRELEDDLAKCGKRVDDLETELEGCKKERTRLRGDLAICQGQNKELLAKIEGGDAKAGMTVNPIVDVKPDPPLTKDTVDKLKEDQLSFAPVTPKASTSKPSAAQLKKLSEDNLQIIEGIGPKMESVLHENGITNWGVLASKSPGELKAVLDRYGDKYRIIDPSGWADQARYAKDGDWDGLIAKQKTEGSESKAEKVMVKLGIIKAYKENDLKAIEGIGPKIEELLQDAGIHTWGQLSDTSVERLKTILSNAGSRYQLADPASWPKQAGMAAEGDWDALEEFQEFLSGGRTPE